MDIDQRTLDRNEVVSITAEVSIAVIQTHLRSFYDGANIHHVLIFMYTQHVLLKIVK